MSDRQLDAATVVANLCTEVAAARAEIAKAETSRSGEVRNISARVDRMETAINSLSVKIGRPGGGLLDNTTITLREQARGLLELKHQIKTPKSSPDDQPLSFSEAELEEAEHAVRGLKHLFKAHTISQLPMIEQKALTSFNMGASGFVLQPEMSSQILSCLTEISDVTGLVNSVSISSASIKFMTDNVLITSGWACDTSCFANNPPADFMSGVGELEIKCESLRFATCAGRDLLDDASFDVEQWVFRKVASSFRNTLSSAIMMGDGVGKPMGLLHPSSGVPVCDTSVNTRPGEFTWQDLYSLAYEVPIQYHSGAVWLMNQRTFSKVLTMSDANGRPLMVAMPTDAGRFVIAGWPVVVTTQMPDVLPGATPILFGNLKETYMLVYRKQTYALPDPYSLGYCVILRFEMRAGGAVICNNASRLLRIK